jgi:hypothetical protein
VITYLVGLAILCSPLEPLIGPTVPLPRVSAACRLTIERIAQHEAGHGSNEMIEFVAETVVADIFTRGIACATLTRWRWAIGTQPLVISDRVQHIVTTVLARWPHHAHPVCRFVGMPRDLAHWQPYGAHENYRITMTQQSLIVIGADCH